MFNIYRIYNSSFNNSFTLSSSIVIKFPLSLIILLIILSLNSFEFTLNNLVKSSNFESMKII